MVTYIHEFEDEEGNGIPSSEIIHSGLQYEILIGYVSANPLDDSEIVFTYTIRPARDAFEIEMQMLNDIERGEHDGSDIEGDILP